MNPYEGMFIFPEALNDEALDEAVGAVKAEIDRRGGTVESVTRLGKRGFARPMKKQKAGHYFVLRFLLAGDQVRPLLERFKLMPGVFRAQVLRAGEVAEEQKADAAAAAEVEKKEEGDGVT